MNDRTDLPIWVVYDHPTDFPNNFVARLWLGERVTVAMMIGPNLDRLRAELERMGLVRLDRQPGDDPKILETWL
jgi:hypothetical protein